MGILSTVYLTFCAGMIIYTLLGVYWVYYYFYGSDAVRKIMGDRLPGLGLALTIFILVPAIMLILHHVGVITLWGIGSAFPKL